ncbi:MAG: thioredoxin domain-containing protein [Hyphomicrobiales bacterium]
MSHNHLASEPSPYLLQHKDNPVHWYPWGDEAFEAAKAQNKPILLSVGYAACHWCHVMAHESFEDTETAAMMNEFFINIKLDREERPDIDKIYMEALQHLGEPGGWPLTMFLTPEREPFWGGTYFPKAAQYGRPSFTNVLTQISEVYKTQPEKIANNAKALTQALSRQPRISTTEDLTIELLDTAAGRVHGIVDMQRGGIQGAPKFPQAQLFEFLWRHFARTGNEISKGATFVTLQNICQGGIYDHIGGGFARYSVDADWLVPHFEKMLYDNAQILSLLASAWQHTKNELFRQRIEETITWLEREMITEEGTFAASLDADSEGEEGRFYVWQKFEVTKVLGVENDTFCAAFDITDEGNWEGKSIPNRLHTIGEKFSDTFQESRVKLLAEREKRIRPGLDDKILTDWNGLMISTLAECALVFERNDWRALAEAAFNGIKNLLWKPKGFLQSYRDGKTRYRATADGYANMIKAALALYELTVKNEFLEDAVAWTKELNTSYWNEQTGGYFFTHSEATDVIRRTLAAHDDAVPNANATMLKNLIRLYVLTGDEEYRQRGDLLISHFAPEALANIVAHAGFANGFEDFVNLEQHVLIGSGKKANDLQRAILNDARPTRFLFRIRKSTELPADHPAQSKMGAQKDALFICKGQTCSLPITDVEDIPPAINVQAPSP